MINNYPKEWDQLPKHERRKKIKGLRREKKHKAELIKKIQKWGLILVVLILISIGFSQFTKKSPQQIKYEEEMKSVSLDGRVEEFSIEGRGHVSAGTTVGYETNPPTSGDHLAEAKSWGVYNTEIDDKAGVHGLEHGGIWITYKDLDEESIEILNEIGKSNSQSVIVSPRSVNEDKIVVSSWGKMMKLEAVEKALIQKYINTYKNQSPEKIAR